MQTLQVHRLEQAHELAVTDLLSSTRDDLRRVYASGVPADAMRAAKVEAFQALKRDYAGLRESWGGRAPYAAWFAREINNAHLASVATYFVCVPGFERELASVHGDLPAFYRRVRTLAKLPQKTRDARVCGDVATE